MHIQKVLSAIIFGTCFVVSANAATKCVALDLDTTCTNTSGDGGQVDWSASCTTSGINVAISGIAACSSQNGSYTGTKSETIATSETTNANNYCWCKMTSPAVSSWVFSSANYSAGNSSDNCAYFCSYDCAVSAAYPYMSSFRAALFSDMQ